jgi:glycosyltransferase involved in cell wall biosynthesis
MIDFEVNSPAYWDSRFEREWAQTQGCEQTQYFAGIVLDELPLWLQNEIRENRLSICDWGCAEGEAVASFRTAFPNSRVTGIDRSSNAIHKAVDKFGAEHFTCHDVLTEPLSGSFDVLVVSNVLQYFQEPSHVLRTLGSHTERHLVVLAPIEDTTIATHIGPDFVLSFCKVIDCAQHAVRYWNGSQILLVYSRSDESRRGNSLAEELRSATALLKNSEVDLQSAARREAELQSDLQYWRTKTAEFENELQQQASSEANLRSATRRLTEDLARLRAAEKDYAAEKQALSFQVAASEREAGDARRLFSEIRHSLSWRITAPLRALTKPLFQSLKGGIKPTEASAQPGAAASPVAASGVRSVPAGPGPIETIILPELQRAQSIAVVSCAIPFSSKVNQRPSNIARYFADRGTTVLFAELWECPGDPTHLTGEQVYPGVFGIPFYAFQPKIVHTFQENVNVLASASGARSSYVCSLPIGGLVEVARPLRGAGYHIHYDIIDDWEEFHRVGDAPWYEAAVEREIVALADTVSAVSDKLAEKFSYLRSDIAVIRNGFYPSALACDQFIAARTPLENPKTIGYFGHFSDGWFDWEAVFATARKYPDVEFELIGYGLSDSSRARLSGFPNIRFVGLVPQNELHHYAKKWWAGIIPFRASTLSAAVDPLKIYEYLYFGLPTIVTGIPGIASFPLVEFADDPDTFVAAIGKVTARPDEQALGEVSVFLKGCVWEARLAQLDSMLGQPCGLPFLYAH